MELSKSDLFSMIRDIIIKSRSRVFLTANSALLETYWQIGKLIVEDEQNGKSRVDYGKATLKNLSQQLTTEFGKGFDERNLNNMRAFYNSFPIWYALRTELSWTHYRLLSGLDTKQKRSYYSSESITYKKGRNSILNDKNKLFASKYLLYLPKEEELKTLIETDRQRFELEKL